MPRPAPHPAGLGHVLTARGELRWCPVHEVALTHTTYAGWHWHPFTATTLHIALAWARYFGCARQIVVVEVACEACEAAARRA